MHIHAVKPPQKGEVAEASAEAERFSIAALLRIASLV
jgi:hypothetical protein